MVLDSLIRTLVPVVAGSILGQAARVGLDLPPGAVADLVTLVVTGVYYWMGRVLENRWPQAGRWLLAAGLTSARPVYRWPVRR